MSWRNTHRCRQLPAALVLLALAAGGCSRQDPPPGTPPATGSAPATQRGPLPGGPDWPAAGGGGAMTGRAEEIGRPPLQVRWRYRCVPAGREGLIEGGPVAAGGVAYVADRNGVLHAIDLDTGQGKWQYRGADEGFATTPLVADGLVLIGDLGSIFHAVDAATGQMRWKFESRGAIHASAAQAGGRVLFGDDTGQMIALHIADGSVAWMQKALDRVNAAPAVVGEFAYFTACDSRVRKLRLTDGTVVAEAQVEGVIAGSPAVTGKHVIVGTMERGTVTCLAAEDLQALWIYRDLTDKQNIYASPAIGLGGVAIVGARDNAVHAIDLETGTRKWIFSARANMDAAAVVAGSLVYVGSIDKRLYVLDADTGRAVWQFSPGKPIQAPVAVAGGVVLLADATGTVWCLEPVGK